MKGVKQEELTVTETTDENQKFVQINISSETIGEFSRKIPLPEATSDWSVNFVEGNLRLRW
jgi:HSP20 family molecular chaperone IbpA